MMLAGRPPFLWSILGHDSVSCCMWFAWSVLCFPLRERIKNKAGKKHRTLNANSIAAMMAAVVRPHIRQRPIKKNKDSQCGGGPYVLKRKDSLRKRAAHYILKCSGADK